MFGGTVSNTKSLDSFFLSLKVKHSLPFYFIFFLPAVVTDVLNSGFGFNKEIVISSPMIRGH